MGIFKMSDTEAADRVAHFVEEQIAKALQEDPKAEINELSDVDNLMEWETAVARVEAYDECYEIVRKTKSKVSSILYGQEVAGHQVQQELSLALTQIIDLIKKARK